MTPPTTKLPPKRPFLAKGYVPDLLQHHTQKDGQLLMRAARAMMIPKTYSLEAYEAPIFDQGSSGSCVGHGSSQGLFTSFNAIGQNLGFVPSPLAIYQLARIMGFATSQDLLTDSGAQPFFAMQGLNQYGIRPIGPLAGDGRNSDVTPANVNTKPLLSQLEEEGLVIVTGEYRIDIEDSGAIAQICSCISQGVAVGFGFQVDAEFEDWIPTRGPMATYDATNYKGGHWVCATSYDNFSATAPEKTILRGPNSWSRGWGENGHFEVTGGWLKKTTIDIYPFVARKVEA